MGKGGRQRSSAYVDPRDIEGCEALLEAHFTQVLLSPLSFSIGHKQLFEGRLCHWMLGLCLYTGPCPLHHEPDPPPSLTQGAPPNKPLLPNNHPQPLPNEPLPL